MNSGDHICRAATTRLLGGVATLYLVFIFYGSWVPLHFVPLRFGEALQTFAALPFSEQAIDSAADWATNFLLLIPLVFLWEQIFLQERHGLSRLVYRLLIIGIGVAVAFSLEFSQLYFPPRTVSQKDILALSMGAIVGGFAQQQWGDSVELWLSALWQNARGQTRLIQLLHVYLLVFFVFGIFPLDLTISLVEIYHKWGEGRVVLVPFGGLKGGAVDNIYETATDLLVWVPVGLLLALDRKLLLISVAGIAWFVAGIIEVAQLFVYSRVTDVTDVLLAGFGAAIGAWLAGKGSVIIRMFSAISAVQIFSMWIIWAILVCCVFWYPFDFQTEGVNIENAWIALTRTPFLILFEGSELNAINEILRKIAFFIPGGVIWCLGIAAFRKKYLNKKSYISIFFFAHAFVALVVETGQLFIPGKFADVTDVLLEMAGAQIGLLASAWVLSALNIIKNSEKSIYYKPGNIYLPLGKNGFLSKKFFVLTPSGYVSRLTDNAIIAKLPSLIDFLPLALTSLGLAWLIGQENLLSLSTFWSVIPIVGIVASAFSIRFPEVAVISYLIVAYVLPRYASEYIFIINAGVLDWICLIGFVGWGVNSFRRSCWPQWMHPISLVFFAFLIVLGLSWGAASWSNSFQGDVFARHTPLLFLHALALFLITSTLRVRSKSVVIWGLILSFLPSFRWYLQSTWGVYLDNDISSFSTLLLPIALIGSWYVQRIWIRTLFLASAIAMLGIVGLAQNRAAAISLVVSLLYLVWREFNRQRVEAVCKNKWSPVNYWSGLLNVPTSVLKRLSLLAVILLVLVLSYAFLPLKEYQERFSVLWNPNATHATASLDRATIEERYELWSGGIEMALDHPILGVGPGNYANWIGVYQIGKSRLPAHNSFISVAAEAGLIALTLFVLLIYLGFRTLGKISRQSEISVLHGTAVALQSSIIAFITVGIFMSRHDLVFIYIVLGFVVALNATVKTTVMSSQGRLCKAVDNPGELEPNLVLPEGGAAKAVTKAQTDHLGGLYGLRAIAALSVFGVHFNQITALDFNIGPFEMGRWLANGNTGVALFFVLSGFLLSLPFWRHKYADGTRVDIKSYYFRRLARILPAYYLCLFGLVAIMLTNGRIPDVSNILLHVVFLYNVDERNILSLNAPFWSLAVEMQFYLFLPLLMIVLSRLSVRAALILLAVLAVGGYFANYGLMYYLATRNQWPIQMTLIWPILLNISGPDSFVLTYSLLAHLTYFLIGIATALLFVLGASGSQAFSKRPPEGAVADLIFGCCAAVVFLILSTPLDDVTQTPYGHYNWPFVPLLLAVMIFVIPRSKFAKSLLEMRLLRWLGAISYGFYIFHLPILTFVARLFNQAGFPPADFWWLFAALSLFASVVVAMVSYWLLELPVMRWASGGYRILQPVRGDQMLLAEGRLISVPGDNEVSPRHSSGVN